MSSSLLAEKFDILHATSAACAVMTDGMSAGAVLRLRAMLQAARFSVILCDTAKAALAACRREGVTLLVTSGTEQGRRLLAWMRQGDESGVEQGAAVTRIALLAEEEGPEAVLEMLMAGANECLVWPFGEQMLAQRLRMVMQAA